MSTKRNDASSSDSANMSPTSVLERVFLIKLNMNQPDRVSSPTNVEASATVVNVPDYCVNCNASCLLAVSLLHPSHSTPLVLVEANYKELVNEILYEVTRTLTDENDTSASIKMKTKSWDLNNLTSTYARYKSDMELIEPLTLKYFIDSYNRITNFVNQSYKFFGDASSQSAALIASILNECKLQIVRFTVLVLLNVYSPPDTK